MSASFFRPGPARIEVTLEELGSTVHLRQLDEVDGVIVERLPVIDPTKIDDGSFIVWPQMEYSGHLYRNSIHETSDSCGNCDGGRCGDDVRDSIQCREIRWVELEQE